MQAQIDFFSAANSTANAIKELQGYQLVAFVVILVIIFGGFIWLRKISLQMQQLKLQSAAAESDGKTRLAHAEEDRKTAEILSTLINTFIEQNKEIAPSNIRLAASNERVATALEGFDKAVTRNSEAMRDLTTAQSHSADTIARTISSEYDKIGAIVIQQAGAISELEQKGTEMNTSLEALTQKVSDVESRLKHIEEQLKTGLLSEKDRAVLFAELKNIGISLKEISNELGLSKQDKENPSHDQ